MHLKPGRYQTMSSGHCVALSKVIFVVYYKSKEIRKYFDKVISAQSHKKNGRLKFLFPFFCRLGVQSG